MNSSELLSEYINILTKWNRVINLVHSSSLSNALERHIKDSLQICDMIDKNDCVIDAGTGAGFPGVILAIQGFDNVILCEKNHKKCIFLTEIKSKLGLNFNIYNGDIYNLNVPRGTFKNFTLVSRALGSLSKLLDIMVTLKIDNGVFHKGKKYPEEIQVAQNDGFIFKCTVKQSITNKNSAIINVFDIRRI